MVVERGLRKSLLMLVKGAIPPFNLRNHTGGIAVSALRAYSPGGLGVLNSLRHLSLESTLWAGCFVQSPSFQLGPMPQFGS